MNAANALARKAEPPSTVNNEIIVTPSGLRFCILLHRYRVRTTSHEYNSYKIIDYL